MPSQYSPDLRIELIGTGDQAGVWGSTTNNNLSYVVEQAIAGYITVTVNSTNQALTYINGGSSVAADNQSVFAGIALATGTVLANFNIYAPPSPKQYVIYNATSYTATIYNSYPNIGSLATNGTGVAIPAGKVMTVWSDGTNFAQQNTHLNSPSFTTPALGTPASGTLTNCTGLPVSTGVSGLGAGVATFLGTPSSSNLAAAVTDETGTGSLVFANSPTLSGTPLAPTATYGTNTTQLATTAFVQSALQALYPVGSIYSSTVSTNPGTLFGFGTWVAYAAGRVLIGTDGSSYLPGATGGSADATLVSHTHTASSSSSFTGSAVTSGAQSVDHTHTFSGTTSGQSNTHSHSITVDSGGAHAHTYKTYGLGNSGLQGNAYTNYDWGWATTGNPAGTNEGTHSHSASAGLNNADHSHTYSGTTSGMSVGHTHSVTAAGSVSTSTTINASGSSATGANLQPYVVVYMWNRTA